MIAYLNRTKESVSTITKVPQNLISLTTINASMLFEIACVRAEKMLKEEEVINHECLEEANRRQSRYFDAQIAKEITINDQLAIDFTANNLVEGLRALSSNSSISVAPKIPGLHWIASSEGDFAYNDKLVEVKCIAKNFSANDYRQLLFYWLLKAAKVINTNEPNWEYGILFNPRLNHVVKFKFTELLNLVSGGRDLIATIELLQSILLSGRRNLT
ncbi:hypothetical protein EYS14_07215 [Alteromonadaceae bacterium M269]|nr:hypothetical protein EYS14_07215 [Alteromonadaceae bacterium M269]